MVDLWDANIPSRVNRGTHYVPSTGRSGTLPGDHKGESAFSPEPPGMLANSTSAG